MLYAEFDDLKAVSNDLSDVAGMTLSAVMRNEMGFLPNFLAHYRALGVERFIFLDDNSDDGSRAYLAEQPDVMVLGSAMGFGQMVAIEQGPLAGTQIRALHIWRSLLKSKYSTDQWSLQLDLDEFLVLPEGMDLPQLCAIAETCRPEGQGLGVVAAMCDLYPKTLQAMRAGRDMEVEGGWYFDAVPHLEFGAPEMPEQIYNGARARLVVQHGLTAIGKKRSLRNLLGARDFPRFNQLSKVFLMRWQEGGTYVGAHETSLPVCRDIILPLKHYKFSPGLYGRLRHAIEGGHYYKGSQEYQALAKLLEAMSTGSGRFTCRFSRSADDVTAFQKSGNIILP